MANGDPLSDEYVIRSGVRSGLKREFAFALKAQAELPPSLGRTRGARKSYGAAPLSPPPTGAKKMRKSEKEDESSKMEAPVVLDEVDMDAPIVIDGPDGSDGSDGSTLSDLEVVVESPEVGAGSKIPILIDGQDAVVEEKVEEAEVVEVVEPERVKLRKVPTNIGELLATGLLEGLSVRYMTVGTSKEVGLRGVITSGGILCSCSSCKGSKVISVHQFEQHACSPKKHPTGFVCLEDGKRILDVLDACKDSPLLMLEPLIRNVISQKDLTCQKCKGLFHTSNTATFSLVCESCLEANQPQANPSTPDVTDSRARLSPPVSVSNSYDKSTSENVSERKQAKSGKLTRKDLGLHKLVFQSSEFHGETVGYYVRGQVATLFGSIQESGILCHCCGIVMSPSQFEAHAGEAQRRKPYNNIYFNTGLSLHELSVRLSKDRKKTESENDDLCGICSDGGNLILCDLCPRAFHPVCLGLESIPEGDWICRYCQNMHRREKCVEYNKNAIAAGRVAGVDPVEEIFKRCVRVLKTPETDIGGCVFCRRHDFTRSFGPRTVIICEQCEKEYHVGCLKAHNMCDLKKLPEKEWFCGADCNNIHAALQEIVHRGAQPLPDLDLDIIRRKHGEKGLNQEIADVKWILLRGKTCKTSVPDNKLLLSRVVSVFHESIDPIIDFATRRDLIPSMVYGKNHSEEHDLRGMYCAVLTVGSSVVSAGVFRVLGCDVAELPLVATSRESQKLGYFQSLFSCIERLLWSLKVKHFVLPAAEEAVSIWTQKFGFTKISRDEINNFTKGVRTMEFQGTSMLHKPVFFDLEVPCKEAKEAC